MSVQDRVWQRAIEAGLAEVFDRARESCDEPMPSVPAQQFVEEPAPHPARDHGGEQSTHARFAKVLAAAAAVVVVALVPFVSKRGDATATSIGGALHAAAATSVSTKEDIAQLATSTQCVYLVNAKPGALQALSRLHNLRELRVVTKLSTTLSVPGTLTDDDLAIIATIGTLTSLRIQHTIGFSGRGLRALAQLRQLHTLRIDQHAGAGQSVHDEHLTALAHLSQVRSLTVSGGSTISDAGLQKLAAMPQLRELHLNLHAPRVTAVGWQVLDHLNALQILDLAPPINTWNDFQPSGVMLLLDGKPTQFDNASLSRVDDDACRSLARMPDLQQLQIPFSTALSDDGLQHLANCSKLRVLDVDGCPNITHRGLLHLPQSLRELSLRECQVSLQFVRRLLGLRSLAVANHVSLQDEDIDAVVSLPELRELELEACLTPRVDSLAVLAKARGVSRLSLRGTAANDSVAQAIASLPKLQDLDLSGLRRTLTIAGKEIPRGRVFGEAALAALGTCSTLERLRLLYWPGLPVAHLRQLRSLPLGQLIVLATPINYDEQTRDAAELRALWPNALVQVSR